MQKFRKPSSLITVIFLLLVLVSGCASPQPVATEAPTQLPTEVPVPTATSMPARMLLVENSGTAADEVLNYLNEVAIENALILETIPDYQSVSIGDETRVVIFLTEPGNLAEIAASSPATQFIVAGSFDQTAYSNVSVIRSKPEDLAFMAGYLATLIAWDWRSAGFVSDHADAFENGGRYLCGQCTPYWAPFKYFPLVAATASLEEITTMGSFYVNTYFVDPIYASQETLDAISALEAVAYRPMTLIGVNGTPLPDRFTALLGYDLLPGLRGILPQVLGGVGGLQASAKVVIHSYTDERKISPAKMDLFNSVSSRLELELIIPKSIQ